MSTSTLPAPVRQRPAAHGVCRWVSGRPTIDALLAGLPILQITPTLAAGPRHTTTGAPVCYSVKAVLNHGKLAGFTLSRCDCDAVYFVDTSFGGGVENWDCNCPDSLNRPAKACKHKAGLSAALSAVNLDL